MCGRVTITEANAARLAQYFGIQTPMRIDPRYNLAPTQSIPVLRPAASGEREFVLLRWGLTAPWSSDAAPIINVRSETVASKRMFKESFMQRRCLVPVDGFYEWKKNGRSRQAHHFRLKDKGIYALGAIWQAADPLHGATEDSCAILTIEANDVVRPLHDRMPLIIQPKDHEAWLCVKTPLDEIQPLLRPFPSENMIANPVGHWVNDVKNEGPKCLESKEPERMLFE